MKNSMRKAMISTVCMLIVAVMSLTGVTYAWFTAGSDATVDNISVNVTTADGGIQFSVDNGASWASQISAGQASTFIPVSTVGALTDAKKINFFRGTVNPANMGEIKTEATSTGFFSKTVDVRNISGGPIEVQLANLADADIESTNDKDAHYAVRIAVVVEKRYTSTANYKAGTGTLDGQIGIYEPFATEHTANAISVSGAVEGAAKDYKGVFAATGAIVVETPAEGDPVYAEYLSVSDERIVAELSTDILTLDAETIQISLENDEHATITIYVWMEGQDVDCENSIAGGNFTFDLTFEKVTTPAN